MSASSWMKRVFGVLLFGAGASVCLGGCAEAEGAFTIEKFCPAEAGAGACEDVGIADDLAAFSCDGGDCRGSFAKTGSDAVFALLANNLTSSLKSLSNNNPVETSNVTLEFYDVSVRSADGVVLEWSAPTGGFINAGEDLAWYGAILTPEFLATLDGQLASGESIPVVIGVKVYGRTTGALSVETPYNYLSVTVQKK